MEYMEIEEQHPIPQQVSSYQFKLVGDMTLQQFFQVAAGVLIALAVYSTNFPVYVKLPLILVSFLTGIAFAFFPLEDRPLSKWLVLFFKAIYSPTLYIWKRTPAKHSYFMPENASLAQTNSPAQEQANNTRPPQGAAKLEHEEKKFLDKVSKDLGDSKPQKPAINTKNEETKKAKPLVQTPVAAKPKIIPQEKPTTQVAQNVQSVPAQTDVFKLTPSTGQKVQNAQSVKFSEEAAPPLPPTIANVVVGQVIDKEGKIIENAILEIRDSEGRPARALKSNKLGHFMIVTPLENGDYQITAEKEGFIFDTLNLKVNGEIIPPIAVWAKGKVQNQSSEPIKV